MQNMRISFWVIFLLNISLFSITLGANAQSSPVPMLERATSQIITTLQENQSRLQSQPTIVRLAVQQYFLPIVDVQGMSRSVLGRQAWMKASLAEKKAFAHAFTQLVIRTYATPLAEYKDEKVQFLPLRGSLEQRFIRVHSLIIRSKGKNIPISYSLVARQGQWKVYDLSVEGISLLQSFRSQFAQELQNATLASLIQQMQKRTKAL